MDMRFGTFNVRSFYRAGSLITVLRELARYKLDLVGVPEVRWEGGGTEHAGELGTSVAMMYGRDQLRDCALKPYRLSNYCIKV
jgi:hypothetical protein